MPLAEDEERPVRRGDGELRPEVPLITLRVHCREFVFSIRVDPANSFKWLGFVTKSRYADMHKRFSAEQFSAVHVCSWANQTPLFPGQQIGECCKDGEEIEVELIGPTIGLGDASITREKTLWELYAYTPPQNFVTITFVFDAAEHQPVEEVGVFGNFNDWNVPIPIKKDTGTQIWRHQMSFPAGSQIVFAFVLDQKKHVVAPNYGVVIYPHGSSLNYFRVNPPEMDYGELRVTPPPTMELDEKEEAPKAPVSKRVAGHFKGVRRLSPDARLAQFENDWVKVQFADVLRSLEERNKVKAVILKHVDKLSQIFRYYSTQGGRDHAYMNIIKFVHFCHICKIPDKNRVTVITLGHIFHRVNVEEEFDEAMIAENPEGFRYAMKIKDDPFNPNNQFIRGEFYEAIIRVALIKFRAHSPMDAVTRLIEQHVLLNALVAREDTIRERLLDDEVQQVFKVYCGRLYKLFKHYAKADQTDLTPGASATINLKEYDMMLANFGLLDAKLSRRLAMTAFALSQEEEVGHDQQSLYEMIYPEFLEALARLAEARYKFETKIGRTGKIKRTDRQLGLAESLLQLLQDIFPSEESKSPQYLLRKQQRLNEEAPVEKPDPKGGESAEEPTGKKELGEKPPRRVRVQP